MSVYRAIGLNEGYREIEQNVRRIKPWRKLSLMLIKANGVCYQMPSESLTALDNLQEKLRLYTVLVSTEEIINLLQWPGCGWIV